ncbi:MAG TPA: hypothetical protein VN719_06400, partial [Gemmatimonadales bacterium]|nr:hypothetical protein [Gemmatimonadales bacterium]
TMILDDLHDEENSRTPDGRAEVVSRYYRTLLDRADPQGCRRIAVGRWWAPDDLYQEWRRSGDWVVMELPATRKGGSSRLWYDVYVPRGLDCVFTETLEPDPIQDQASLYTKYRAYYAAVDRTGMGFYWPSSPTKRRNYEVVRRRQPRVAAINYDGDMTGGGEAIFREDDFRPYAPPQDIDLGIQAPHVRSWARALKGDVEEAWDTALGQPQSTSLTAALTGLMVPCRSWHRGEDESVVGPCDFHYDVYLLDLMVRNLDFRGLAMELRARYGKWHPRRVIVEEKQSGVSLLQTFRGTQVPVWGQKVEQGKVERAVNPVLRDTVIPGGAASVQGWARMGRILVPAGLPWLHEPHGDASEGFLNKVCAFSGGTKASDEFDTLVHLVTRAVVLSRQVAYLPGAENDSMPLPDPPPFGWEDPRQSAIEAFQGIAAHAAPESSDTPFGGLCGSPCAHYAVFDNKERCRRHNRVTHALDGCPDWARWGSVPADAELMP